MVHGGSLMRDLITPRAATDFPIEPARGDQCSFELGGGSRLTRLKSGLISQRVDTWLFGGQFDLSALCGRGGVYRLDTYANPKLCQEMASALPAASAFGDWGIVLCGASRKSDEWNIGGTIS